MADHTPEEDRRRFEQLMMGIVDGELDPAEQREFETLLVAHPEYQSEWKAYRKLKEVTMQLQFKSAPDEVWDRYWTGIYNRIERGVAWLLISLGAAVLLTYAGFKAVESLIADPNLELITKVGMIAVIGGLAILLVSLIRERLFTRKTDKYAKEVKR